MATSTPVNCNSTGSHKFRVYVTNASDNGTATNTTYKRSLTTRGEFYNNAKSTWSPSGTVVTTFTPNKTFSYDSSITTQTVTSNFSSVSVAAKSTDYSKTTSSYSHAATFIKACESYTVTNKTVGTINSYTTTYTGSAVTIAARTKYTITYNLNKTGAVHATGYQTYCTACGGDHKSYGYSARVYTNSSGTGLTPTCTGYKFLGWSTSSTATTPMYYSGDTYSTNADLTLYGVWQKAYTIAVYPFSGQIAPAAGTVTGGGTYDYGNTVTITATPNIDYVFDGWWRGTHMGGDTQVSTNSTYTFTCIGSASYWAHFHLNKTTVTLTVDANGGSVPSTSGWSPSGGASSQKSKTVWVGMDYSDCGYLPIPTRTNYAFEGWYSLASGGNQFTSSDGVITDAYSTAVDNYYDWETGDWIGTSNLTLYAHWIYDGEYTLTIRYHLNGGTISTRVYPKGTSASSYYKFGPDSLIYDCSSTGGNPVIHETVLTQCKTSESKTKFINLLNYDTYGSSRSGASIISGSEYITQNGTIINQQTTSALQVNAATVYNLLDGQYITSDTTVILYINWNINTYALDIQYALNGGTISDAPHQSGSHYYKPVNGYVYDTSSSNNRSTPYRTHVECLSNNSQSTVVNLLNYTTYNATRSGYSVPSQAEYITDNGILLNQDTTTTSDTNPATVYNLLGGHNLTANTVITININWTSNTATIYVKTDQGWKKGIVYVKTSSGWKQGTPYIKTTNGWKQGN